MSNTGTLGKLPDGRRFVRFERHLGHSIEKVWAAITTPEHLQAWFPGLTLDARKGGEFSITFGGDCDGPVHVSGVVTVYDPPRCLALGSMCFELDATPSGCRLVFTDILHFDGERTPDEFANSVLSGWHRYVDLLCAHVDGRPVDHDLAEPDYTGVDVPGRELLADVGG